MSNSIYDENFKENLSEDKLENLPEKTYPEEKKKRSYLKWFLAFLVVFSLGGLFSYKFLGGTAPKTKGIVYNEKETANIEAVEKTKNAVVSVVGYSRKQANSPALRNFRNNRDSESAQTKDGMRPVGNGSGVIYKKDGSSAYIVTNNHVIDSVEKVEIILSDGQNVEAELLGRDVWTDLAVLKIDSSKVSSVMEFSDSDRTIVGQDALAIGSPLGLSLSNSVTKGIVSAVDRQIPIDIDEDGAHDWYQTVIQTDAAINPGNSGGALINSSGQLIGINQLKISNLSLSVTAEGIGFVIPANEVKLITEQLEKNQSVKRPALGLQLVSISTLNRDAIKNELKYDPNKKGVIVRGIEKSSAAEKAGLKELDIIVKINDLNIDSVANVRKYLFEKTKIGDSITITYYREGRENTTQLVLGELKNN